jgi:hypothetical protein
MIENANNLGNDAAVPLQDGRWHFLGRATLAPAAGGAGPGLAASLVLEAQRSPLCRLPGRASLGAAL